MTSNSFVLGRKYFLFNGNIPAVLFYIVFVSMEKPRFYEAIGTASFKPRMPL